MRTHKFYCFAFAGVQKPFLEIKKYMSAAVEEGIKPMSTRNNQFIAHFNLFFEGNKKFVAHNKKFFEGIKKFFAHYKKFVDALCALYAGYNGL